MLFISLSTFSFLFLAFITIHNWACKLYIYQQILRVGRPSAAGTIVNIVSALDGDWSRTDNNI